MDRFSAALLWGASGFICAMFLALGLMALAGWLTGYMPHGEAMSAASFFAGVLAGAGCAAFGWALAGSR